MRTIDDKVIYELNNTIPTDYFAKNLNITDQCKDFYDQVGKFIHFQQVPNNTKTIFVLFNHDNRAYVK